MDKKIKITVPESWDDITLGEYESFEIKKSERYIDLVDTVCSICKLDKEAILSYPCSVFNDIVERVRFVFDASFEPRKDIIINGAEYALNVYEKMSLGEYADIDIVLKSENKHSISETLAIALRPIGEKYNPDRTDQRADLFRSLPCSKIMPIAAFFLSITTNLDNALTLCSTTMLTADQYLKEWQTFTKNGDGTTQLSILQTIKSFSYHRSLKSALRKCSDSYYTNKTKVSQITNSLNLTKK